MYNHKRILAIIPARSGSKGIVEKNIMAVNGIPLIKYTIDAAAESKYLDRAIVSTDTTKFKDFIESIGGDVPFLRPKELAADNSPTIDAVMHCIEELEKMGEKYDYMVLLQPTTPLRNGQHIDEAIELLINSQERSLVSVNLVEDHPVLIRTINSDGTVKNLLANTNSTVRRQDFPDFYRVNGAIYIQKIDKELNSKTSLNDGKLAYVMDKSVAVDIDELIDIQRAEYYLKEITAKE